jgi:hypothetical protein
MIQLQHELHLIWHGLQKKTTSTPDTVEPPSSHPYYKQVAISIKNDQIQ